MEQKRAEELRQEILSQANVMAAGYDYDGAMSKLQTVKGYKTDDEVQAKLKKWTAARRTWWNLPPLM